MMLEYVVGIDVAKMANKSSVSIISPSRSYLKWRQEKQVRDRGELRSKPGWIDDPKAYETDSDFEARKPTPTYVLRWLKVLAQPPEGESYISQAARIADLLSKPPPYIGGARNHAVAVDASGVGQGLVDALEANHRLYPYRVIIVGGRNETREHVRREYHVPRNNLVIGVRAALQEPGRTLEIAHDIPSHEELIREGQNLQLEETRAATGANERVGHIREGVGDDRIFSTALAVWLAKRAFAEVLPAEHGMSTANLLYDAPSELPFSASAFEGWG